MATTLQHKRSDTAGSIPSTSSLSFGEIAINTNDGELYIKRDNGSGAEVVRFRGGSASAATETVYIDTATGDGSTRVFTLTISPKNDQYVFATINGVQQHVDAYSIVNDQLTFTDAPANGDDIEFRVLSVVSTDVVLRDKQKYFYSITGTTSSLTGADDAGLTLAYDPGKVDVYQNGVKLIDGYDYTATNGTSVAFTTSLESGDIVEIDSYAKAAILDHDSIKPLSATLAGTTADQIVDSFPTITFRTAKYLVTLTSGTNYHTTEILLIHDGTSVYLTEYATIYTNISLGSFDADISSGYVRLLCTPSQTNTSVKIQRITVTV